MTSSQIVAVEEFINSLSNPASALARTIHNKLRLVDSKGEISQLSKVFAKSLDGKLHYTQSYIDQMGVANFFTWMAYSLYDGVIDQELPLNNVMVANILERESLELYRSNIPNWNLVLNLFNKTDEANAWEISHCRFEFMDNLVVIHQIPTKQELEQMLASRSIAHVIGPVSIYEHHTKSRVKQKKLFESMTEYCIARQLNDDVHDWVEDFKSGRMTYVVAQLLEYVHYPSKTAVNPTVLLKAMKEAFYESGIELLCSEIEAYITSAINKLSQCSIAKDSIFTTTFLRPILDSAQQARNIHQRNKDFVDSYVKLSH